MKIILISAFLCLAGFSQAGNVQRFSRNSEAIIPTIVEEILKVELLSDLKKNNVVEALELAPIVSAIKDEVIIDPISKRIVEEIVTVEEKQPEIVENDAAIKEIEPEIVPATRNVEPVPEIVEKVEIIAVQENVEKPVDNFRTESVPSVELMQEIVKEIVAAEPMNLREKPDAIYMIKEEEIVQPMYRNVIKEEIPQVEELRVVPVEAAEAVKDVLPEPIQAANIAPEPLIAVEPQIKTLIVEVVKEVVPEVKAVPVAPVVPAAPIVLVPVEVKIDEPIKEEKAEIVSVPEVKAVPEILPIEAPAALLPAPVEALPAIDESEPQTRQDRPTIVQTIQQNLANLPVVGQIFNRNPAVADEVAAADDAAPAPVTEEKPPQTGGPLAQVTDFITNAVQTTQQNFGNFVTNVQNAIAPPQNNNAENRPQNPVVGFLQNLVSPTTGAPIIKDEVKPEKAGAKPEAKPEEKPEATKSVEPEPVAVVDPIVVQKEVIEPQQAVETEKENIVTV